MTTKAPGALAALLVATALPAAAQTRLKWAHILTRITNEALAGGECKPTGILAR